jgi:hypothetical protein
LHDQPLCVAAGYPEGCVLHTGNTCIRHSVHTYYVLDWYSLSSVHPAISCLYHRGKSVLGPKLCLFQCAASVRHSRGLQLGQAAVYCSHHYHHSSHSIKLRLLCTALTMVLGLQPCMGCAAGCGACCLNSKEMRSHEINDH